MKLLRASAIFAVLTLALTWPLAANLTVMDAGDSAFFAWEIGWELHAIKTDPASLPHGNIFFPLRYTLGMDEPVLSTTLLVLPFSLFTDDAIWLHNVARLLTWFFTALSAYLLARELGCREGPALLAGALFAWSPIRTDQIAHLSTLGTQWMPLVLLFLHRFARSGRWRDALLGAVAFALQFAACGYHGVIALAVLPIPALVLITGRWRRLPAAITACLLAGLFVLPLYFMHRAALSPEKYVRQESEAIFYSAPLEAFVATSPWNRVYGELTDFTRAANSNNLFPGLVPLLLVTAGVWRIYRERRWPSRDALALGALALGGAIVALGPEVRIFDRSVMPGPFGVLREWAPVFQMIRVTSRAGIFIALPLAILAARSLQSLAPRRLGLAIVFVLALTETLIIPIPVPKWARLLDSREAVPAVDSWLAAQSPGTPIAYLPMLDVRGLERRPRYHETIYMVRSTHHWQPMVNGAAGIEPRRYVRLRELAGAFPNAGFIDALEVLGVRYLILQRRGYGPNQWPRVEAELPLYRDRLVEVARFGEDSVLEIVRRRPALE